MNSYLVIGYSKEEVDFRQDSISFPSDTKLVVHNFSKKEQTEQDLINKIFFTPKNLPKELHCLKKKFVFLIYLNQSYLKKDNPNDELLEAINNAKKHSTTVSLELANSQLTANDISEVYVKNKKNIEKINYSQQILAQRVDENDICLASVPSDNTAYSSDWEQTNFSKNKLDEHRLKWVLSPPELTRVINAIPTKMLTNLINSYGKNQFSPLTNSNFIVLNLAVTQSGSNVTDIQCKSIELPKKTPMWQFNNFNQPETDIEQQHERSKINTKNN